MGKIYVGRPEGPGYEHVGDVVVLNNGDAGKALDPRYDLRNHSPTGFAWGYGGSGPAQLALAMLCDATGDDELAQKYYQEFKFEVIAGLDRDHWTLDADFVTGWVEGRYQ